MKKISTSLLYYEVAVFSIVFFMTAFTSNAQWKSIGPYEPSWGIQTLIVSGKTFFASAKDGGVFRSTDKGNTWTTAKVGLPSNLVMAFTEIDTILCAGTLGGGGVYRSTNYGDTWNVTTLQTGTIVNAIAACGGFVFAGTNSGEVYSSADKGVRWSKTNLSLIAHNVTTLAVNGIVVFAATNTGMIYRTFNNGTAWTPANNSKNINNSAINALLVKDSIIFAGTAKGGMYRSTDNGDTWTEINSGLTSLAVRAIGSKGTALFAGTDSNGVFRSMDNGDTWTEVNIGLPVKSIKSFSAIDSVLLAGTSDGVYRSTDDGNTWMIANIGLISMRVNALTMSGNALFAGTDKAGILRTTDNGNTWKKINPEFAKLPVVSFQTIGTTIFASTHYEVFRSTDNGDTWLRVISYQEVKGSIYSIAVIGKLLFLGASDGNVYRSADNGTTWTQFNIGLSGSAISMLAANDITLFAGVDERGIYRSTDYGESWKSVFTGPGQGTPMIRSLVANGTTVFTRLSLVGIYRSTDNGSTWMLSYGEMIDNALGMVTANNATILVGTGKGIIRSTDNGVTWAAFDSKGLSFFRYPDACIMSGAAVFVGFSSYGVWRYDSLGATGYEEPIANPSSDSQVICYPNPADETITIQRPGQPFNTTDPVTYTVSDIIGKQAMQFDKTETEFTVPVTSLAIGMYTLVARQGDVRLSTIFFVSR